MSPSISLLKDHFAKLRRGPAKSTPDVPGVAAPEGPVVRDTPDVVVHHNLISRDDGTAHAGLWAFYVMKPVDLMYKTPHELRRARTLQQFNWAALAGRNIYLRGLLAPSAIAQYASSMEESTRDVPSAQRDELLACVDRASERMVEYDVLDPVVLLGVHITQRVVPANLLPEVTTTWASGNDTPDWIHSVRREMHQVDAIVRGEGWGARPVTAEGLMWAVSASQGLGLPAPPFNFESIQNSGEWMSLDGFNGGAYVTASEFAPAVTVRAARDFREHEIHVVVQPAGNFGPRDLDAVFEQPWLAWALSTNRPDIGPVEWVVIGAIVPGDQLISSAGLDRRRAEETEKEWLKHEQTPPPEIQRGIGIAAQVEDEVSNAPPEVAARFQGVVLFATCGPDRSGALQRARQLRSDIAREQGIELVDASAQYALYRAFTPGAAQSADLAVIGGNVTRMPLYFLSTAVPNAVPSSGDLRGMPVGPIGGAPGYYLYDPHGAPARNVSGLTAILGQQGTGKTTLATAMVYWSVLTGHRNIVTDPSGQMARLCDLPELRDVSRVFELASASAGAAVPSLLVPEPRRQDFPTIDQYRRAVQEATMARVDVTVDVLREMIPARVLDTDIGAYMIAEIQEAVNERGSHYGADPRDILAHLAAGGTHAQSAERILRAASRNVPVFFPAGDVDDSLIDSHVGSGGSLLTIISLQGVTLPPAGLPRHQWTNEQQRSAPTMLVASLLALRLMYESRGPKQIMLDEIGIIAPSGQGASPMITRAAIESRKWGATVGVIGQSPAMFMGLGDEISNLVGTAFVGGLDSDVGRNALPLLGLGRDSGHEDTIASLGQGEFLVRRRGEHGSFETRRVYFDRSWFNDALRQAVDTTPSVVSRAGPSASLADRLVSP